MKLPKICAGVGAVASVMSKFVHPSNLIRDKYPNRTKNHKMQGVVLVEEDMNVVQRGAYEIPFFFSPMTILPTKNFTPPLETYVLWKLVIDKE